MRGAQAVVISLLCVVVSSLTTTFGLFFQKIAQRRSQALHEPIKIANVRAFKRNTLLIWFAGFLCITIFSFVLDLYSMATLGQSLVVPLLACLEVAENQVFAPVVLGERFDRCRDTTASLVAIIGALLTTFFGPGGPLGEPVVDAWSEMTYRETKAHFAKLFGAPHFLVFEALALALLAACLVLSRHPNFGRLHFLMLGYVAGFLGGQQNMFLKGVGTYLGTGIGGDTSVFADWMLYVFAALMAGLASLQLFFLNLGLARFQALLFVPTYTILYIVNGTLVGLLFYQEHRHMSEFGWGMFCSGFCFIALAMYILATKPDKPCQVSDECDVEVLGKPEPQPLTPTKAKKSPVFAWAPSAPWQKVDHSSSMTSLGPVLPPTPSSVDTLACPPSERRPGRPTENEL